MKTYQDFVPPDEGRSYALAQRTNGTYSITDVTSYRKKGDAWGAADANALMQAGVQVYTHTYHPQTHVHNFTGSGANGRALLSAGYTNGDTFAVNGTACPAYTGGETTEELANGRWTTFVYDGAQLNFKGGGSVLNFKVIAVANAASLPANAKENTIAVITSVAIPSNGYLFAAKEPTGKYAIGTVWISTSATSDAQFNALKQGVLEVYPHPVYQWNGTQFVFRETKIRQGGQWKSLGQFVISKGVLINGIPATNLNGISRQESGFYLLHGTFTAYGESCVYQSFDLTHARRLLATITHADYSNHLDLYIKAAPGAGMWDPGNAAARVSFSTPIGASVTCVLDVSAFSGVFLCCLGGLTYNCSITDFHLE